MHEMRVWRITEMDSYPSYVKNHKTILCPIQEKVSTNQDYTNLM